jgi:CBS domain-containing protein
LGLLVSINGVDFEPYARAEVSTPLVERINHSKKVLPIQRDFDHPEEFQKTLSTIEKTNVSLKYKASAQAPTQNSTKATRAYDLMSKPAITLEEKSDLEQAKVLLTRHNIRHLPVINNTGNIVGMLSDRNIALCHPTANLQEIMTVDIIAAEAHTLLHEIARAMLDHKINSIPILDKNRMLIGIITSTDILESVLKNPNINLFV